MSSDKVTTNHNEKQLDRADTGKTAVTESLPFKAHNALSGKVIEALGSNPTTGLKESEVPPKLDQYGLNRLKPPKKPSVFKIILRQVGNAMTLILIAAMATSFGTTDWISGGVIAALVLLNVSVGAYTEWQAEKTVANLESVGAPQATVVRTREGSREGDTKTIPVEEVVPGDIVLLKNGDIVPADGRILDGHISNLECDEAFLTGESLPVAKQSEPIDEEDCPVGDRLCMVFSGSQVTKGRARVIITHTGMGTEIGKIAEALESKAKNNRKGFGAFWWKTKVLLGVEETTPLQIKLNKLAYFLLGWAIIIAIIVVASTGFKNIPLSMATYAVAAAVSILPASLIAVVSLTLARASTDLASRNALVRRMDAIEALAGVENVCSDKTGTLTVGRMVVRKLWVPTIDHRPSQPSPLDTKGGQAYSFETGSDPFYPRGVVRADRQKIIQVADTLDLKHPQRQESTDSSSSSSEDPEEREVENQEQVVHVEELEDGLRKLALCASLCNVATLSRPVDEDSQWEANGDPTEVALQVAAHKLGHGKPFLTHHAKHASAGGKAGKADSVRSGHSARPLVFGVKGHFEQLVEHPFDSTVKRMSIAYTFHPADSSPSAPSSSHAQPQDGYVACFLKGAVERVFERCTKVGDKGEELTQDKKDDVLKKVDALAAQGLRVLALCGKTYPSKMADEIKHTPRDEFERDFTFLGLAGIYDPPRKESPGAVADCYRAGITPRMLTGDHPATATAIALNIGILEKSYGKESVMTGQQFDALSDEEVDALPELPLVVARCAPETKVRMVDAIHRRGQKTVMTGDGVNDSPALKRADVGVGMGTGSDVAKQSSRIVLSDDNFSTIIRAIRKGRSVFKNLAKFLLYLLSGNLAEIIVLMIGLAFKDQNGQSVFPLSPVAALWINTLAAGPPALALGLEPTAVDAMEQPPSAFHQIFTLEFYIDLIFYGFLIGSLSLVNFVIVLWGYFSGNLGMDCNEGDSDICSSVFQARATCFATLVIILMIHALECKHFYKGLWQINLRDNRVLLWCVVVLVLATFPVVYIPRINDDVFLIGGLKWEWGIVFGMIFVYLLAAEGYKYVKRVWKRRHEPVPAGKGGDKTLRMENTIAPPV
ncbi:potassium/sodium efflux P-type ATPase, fungal-type, variant [Cryptococcus amylolentus CBS 6039]|uniref:Potassium/sodium efflux P-type ATPase, fungal-type, variant n=1 Tax=Cryptococcus amylolentus CBS 6039 TaxID=1295533 RepID=A0A1E3HC61_9TREE|nr:potassium/sodium efflux P-type ATPase, fungal-type, variant [Cryptococcus amylolentus CBS 6039]ODN73715.1 potassium/sodium efflux P-type ATPase, fungal-type, variant [Cryptococcus amylolentus CBS 6039]